MKNIYQQCRRRANGTTIIARISFNNLLRSKKSWVVAQSVKAFASHAGGKIFESPVATDHSLQTDSDSSPAKRSPTGLSVTGPWS